MLGRSIYEETKHDIQQHADNYTSVLREEILAQTALHKAITSALRIAHKYHANIATTIFNRLNEIGANAVEYYAPDLDAEARDAEVSLAMDELVHSKYYGLTLPQRLKQSHLNLRQNIRRSSSVGAKLETKLQNIIRVFNDKYPFGAQKTWDNRLFLAEAVRIEHIIARNIAIKKAYKLVRWTLSDTHSQQDYCDKLGMAVDPTVKAYLDQMKFNTDPHGVYFIEHVPIIPHPNCQCTLQYVHKTRRGRKKRPEKKLNLIQRIIKAIFGK